MTIRTSEKTVTFKFPFTLRELSEAQPAGVYSVETDEELLEGMSFPAYKRIATRIRLHESPDHPGVVQIPRIDPIELEAALQRDAASAAIPAGDPPHPATDAKAKRRDKAADIAAEERSEDDGMAEHREKSDDPAAWAAERAARVAVVRR